LRFRRNWNAELECRIGMPDWNAGDSSVGTVRAGAGWSDTE
jgi:hypothetical protein